MTIAAECGSVVGIDVGCSPKRRSSAICRLEWTASDIKWEIARFRAVEPERERSICMLATGRPVSAAALDGPLRRGFDVIGRYRTAERLLTRRLRPLIGKPGQSSSPVGKLLNHHANECARHLITHADLSDASHGVAIDQKAIVEAFPSAFVGLMIKEPAQLAARRGNRSDVFFEHLARRRVLSALIEYCLPRRRLEPDPDVVRNHDDRAALICALSALCVAVGDFVAVGDEDGWIILPPRRFIQRDQWELLSTNAADVGGGALHEASRN